MAWQESTASLAWAPRAGTSLVFPQPRRNKLWEGPSLFASATEHIQLLPFVSHSSFKYPRFTHSSLCLCSCFQFSQFDYHHGWDCPRIRCCCARHRYDDEALPRSEILGLTCSQAWLNAFCLGKLFNLPSLTKRRLTIKSVLSVKGKKVLHIDRNDHYGG
jgi:hypothetical protein